MHDTVRTSYWKNRLEREAPRSPFAAQNRAGAILGQMAKDKDSVRALADMDRLWNDVGPAHGNVVNLGWQVAQVAADSGGLVRWGDHYLAMNPGDSAWIATVFTRYPALREEGMQRLRRELQTRQSPKASRRALERTVEEQRLVDAESARQILVALGDALVAGGQRAAGLDTLKRAVREGWDASLFRRVAQIHLSTGDTASALRLLGLVAADPATVDFTRPPMDSAAWARLVQEGKLRRSRPPRLAHAGPSVASRLLVPRVRPVQGGAAGPGAFDRAVAVPRGCSRDDHG